MTTPIEKVRAIINARDFLLRLLDPKETPRVPKDIRREARQRVKHLPHEYELTGMLNEDYLKVWRARK